MAIKAWLEFSFLEFRSSGFFFLEPLGMWSPRLFCWSIWDIIYFFFHACGFRMESFVIVCAFLPFSSLLPFGSRGIGEGFCVLFLLRMCMRFPFIFIFIFLIFVAAIMHSECMRPWAFYSSHVDELGLLLCQGFDKVLKRRHLLGGSRGEYDSMECRYEY